MNILKKIAEDEMQIEEEIGSGAAARVYKGKWAGKQVAIKKFNENYNSFNKREFGSELAIMSTLRHPNICHCYGGSVEHGNRFLVSKLFTRGSLLSIIRNKEVQFNLGTITSMLLDAARGMQFLHEVGIIHRDLKSGNLLVDQNWNVSIVDFGISRLVADNMSKKNIGVTCMFFFLILNAKSLPIKRLLFTLHQKSFLDRTTVTSVMCTATL